MIRMIYAVQPAGPYRIAGWSFGGILAYEIAVQLLGDNQQVSFVGMFDSTYLSGERKPPFNVHTFNATECFLAYLERQSQLPSLKLIAEEQCNDIRDKQARGVDISFSDLVHTGQESALINNNYTSEQFRLHLAYMHAATAAICEYYPKPLPVPIYLFSAQDQDRPAETTDWADILDKRLLRVIQVHGDHWSMWTTPYVNELGSTLSKLLDHAAENSTQSDAEASLLRRGQREQAPLFCVPGAGASSTAFVGLVSHLATIGPVYGIEPRGLRSPAVPHSTVRAAASSSIQQIIQRTPTGPIHLLGHSFGGWIAFEVARQLREEGRDVLSLTLLDSFPPHSVLESQEWSQSEVLSEWLKLCEQLLGRPLGVSPSEFEFKSELDQVSTIHTLMVSAGLLPRRSEPGDILTPLRLFATALRVPYSPATAYNGRVHLVLATDSTLEADMELKRQNSIITRWRQIAPNLHHSVTMSNHVTMLKEPYVLELANLQRDFQMDSIDN